MFIYAGLTGDLSPLQQMPNVQSFGSASQSEVSTLMKKPKKRPRAALPPPQQSGAAGTSAEDERKARTASMKRKKADQLEQLSPEMLEDALDTAMYANVASLPQPYEMRIPNKPPPPYEDCVKSAASMQSLRGAGMEAAGAAQPPFFHPRQKSMPAAVGVSPESYLQHMPQQEPPQPAPRQHTLPHSQPHQQQQGYPGLQQMSPGTFMPSPQSSNYSPSPPGPGALSPQALSPCKQRPVMPLSPTHMAAMRGAARHNAHQQQYAYEVSAYGQPEFTQLACGGPQQQQMYPHYPTPPSQHSLGEHVQLSPDYTTPSPDSPGQWSTSSPHSAAGWSDGVCSPPGAQPKPPAPPPPQHQPPVGDGVYI